MTYRAALTAAMDDLARDPLVRFIGYGVRHGRALGTLVNVPEAQLIEMPVAENLMVGFATGLALRGLRPVVYIERCDFILNALDAIVNHLDKLATISAGEFRPAVLLRVTVGNSQKPKFTGPTHTQDFSAQVGQMVTFPFYRARSAESVEFFYGCARQNFAEHRSTAIFEYKDLL